MTEIEIRDLATGDAGWLLLRHGQLYARDEGYNLEFEAVVAEILAGFIRHRQPGRERAFIAHREDDRLGSVFCVQGSAPDMAKLRLFLVDPAARGLGSCPSAWDGRARRAITEWSFGPMKATAPPVRFTPRRAGG